MVDVLRYAGAHNAPNTGAASIFAESAQYFSRIARLVGYALAVSGFDFRLSDKALFLVGNVYTVRLFFFF
ncbi:hypothetical protein ACR52_26810 [Pseudomonas fildesensis]|jgi:hypothetical protein|uniref:Uncharacterized protein n=1 Tax=Pseudomonas fildesensis TaxID=1674920 RepID=A0A0J8ILN8_9PSED|nr:hypothetical protein ACR52_26810 [Pseudomonas fildesensis]